jgi:hypothetical protein
LHGHRQAITVAANTTYTFSFYAKLGTMTSASYSVFNITGATELVVATNYTSKVSKDGWARISVTFTTPTGCTSVGCYPVRDSGSTGTIFIWGCQLETGTNDTTHVPTTTTTATLAAATAASRSADLLTLGSALGLSASNVKAIAAQGSFLNYSATAYSSMVNLNDGTSNNAINLGEYDAIGNFGAKVVIGGTAAKTLNSAGAISKPSTYRKQAISFGNNQTVISQNGSIVNDASNSINSYTGTPTFNQLAIGADQFNGYIGKIQLIANSLNQSQLNALTK